MAHSNTELLIDYWRRRRGERPMPARSEIDPADFAALAALVFIAVREPDRDIRFRLAGEGVIDLHGQPLAGASLLAFWRPQHRPLLATALMASLRNARTLVVTAQASTEDVGGLRLEILFAPLLGPLGRPDRFFGLFQPLARSPRGPVRQFRMLAVNGAGSHENRPHLRLAALNGRRIA